MNRKYPGMQVDNQRLTCVACGMANCLQGQEMKLPVAVRATVRIAGRTLCRAYEKLVMQRSARPDSAKQ
jgi:hypothetical protein